MAAPDLPLKKKVVLITGASRGIGAALAETLAFAGAAVVLLARDGAKLAEVASRINAQGGRAIFVVGDVADAETPAAVVQEAQSSKLVILFRPFTCHKQVRPGLILNLRRCQLS